MRRALSHRRFFTLWRIGLGDALIQRALGQLTLPIEASRPLNFPRSYPKGIALSVEALLMASD